MERLKEGHVVGVDAVGDAGRPAAVEDQTHGDVGNVLCQAPATGEGHRG